ncbi:hypothetical protein M408DRAFT_326410 [Serendipita vermifera MAFF 305830]|uniref:Transmembrane protein n=1 Tax=Serendipita vermifera MAFF 305830 TaxID=933852 RepID=A0A0C2XUT7_SERVB|nr:hypothetical protein M408DRAFT_326410 [Serendipita vermifera MAFF 305830]
MSWRNMAISGAICLLSLAAAINHFVLYRLSQKQITALSPSEDGTVAYPNCLFSLVNIIFTCVVALALLGIMWMPLGNGIILLSSGRFYFCGGVPFTLILQGVVGYAESGVLLTLFVLYVRQRRVHFKAVREGRLKALGRRVTSEYWR